MSIDVIYNPKPKGKPMSKKRWSEKLIENAATSNVILSRQEWDSLIEGIRSLEAELDAARRARGSGWEKFANRLEAVSDRKHLESENAELRKRAEDAEKGHENCIKVSDNLRDINCELREKLAAVERENEELYHENAKYELVVANKDRKATECHKQVIKLESELARLKSQPESSQWAVTCEGMDREDAVDAAHRLYQRAGVEHKAVPLLALEDGPWVLCRREAVGVFYRPYGSGGTGSLETAYKYETREAAERDCGSRYVPVRLSDVAE